MPLTGGEYKPEDVADVAVLQSGLQDAAVAEPQNIPIDYSAVQDAPTMGEINDLIVNDWPTSKIDRYLMDFATEWPDPNFKQPWDTLEPKYYPYKKLFEDAYNPSAWQKATNYAQQEIDDDIMRGRMTPAQWAYYFAGSMMDPVTLSLSIGTFGLATVGRGLTVGQAAVRTGGLVAAEATAIEGMLQLADPMRTAEESGVSILAGAAFGALTGAGGQKVWNLFHNAKGQRNAADQLPAVIHKNVEDEVNLARVENALEMDVPLDNVTIPPPPKELPAPVQSEVDVVPTDPEKIFPDEVGFGLGGRYKPEAWGDEGSELYHETSLSDMSTLLGAQARGSDDVIYVSDNPDLALGQHGNKGVHVTFRGDRISANVYEKPGAVFLDGKEYTTNFIARDAIKSIVMPTKTAETIPFFMGQTFKNKFDRVDADGTTTFTPKIPKEPPPARMAIEEEPLPPSSFYVNESPTDFDEVTGALDDWIDTRDPSQFGTTSIGDETPLFSPFKPIVHNRVMMSPVTILMYNGTSPTFSRLGDMFGANNIYKHGDYNQTRYNGITLREEIKRSERGAFMKMSDGSAATQNALVKRGIKVDIDSVANAAGRAARRSSDESDFEPEIYALGQKFRQELDQWKERGIEQGVLTEKNLVELENYVPRFWDMDTVTRKPARFRSKIKAWAAAKPKFADMEPEELDQLVVDIKDSLNRINAGEDHPMVFHVHRKPTKSGHAKPRRIDASDLDLEEFLVSDIRVLLDRYVRGVGADIIVREIFGKDNIRDINGLPMPKAQYDQGVREFDVALQALEEQVDAGSKLAKMKYKRLEKKRALTIKAAENYLRGAMQRPEISRFPRLDSFGRGLQGYSAATGLGGVIQAAQPDAGNNILQHGLVNMLGALPEFFKALPQVFSRNVAGTRRAVYWREHMVALDNLLSNRMMAVAGLEDASTYGVKQGWWHGTEVARKAFRIFLADRWNTAAKLLSGTSAERRIFKDVQKKGKGTLGKNRSAKLHQMGATQDVANRIVANLKEHGKTNGLINWDKWDEQTLNDLSRMLFRESEFQVVAPDGGEAADWMNTFIGRLFMQYKTFMLSNTLKQTIPWSQKLFAKGDVSVLVGLSVMGGLAIWSRYIRDVTKSFDKDSGFDIDQVNKDWANKTAADLAAIAVRDGALLSFADALIAGTDNFFNNELGEAVGMTPRKRYWSPGLGIESNMAGLGYADTLRAATWASARSVTGQHEFTAKDLNKVRRSVPLQNTFYLQWLFDWGEQSIVEEFNLPESNKKKSSGRL